MDPDPALLGMILTHYLLATAVSALPLIGLLILLLMGSAVISASEVAYFSLSPKDLDNLSLDPSPRDRKILRLKDRPRHLLATILVSNNFINIAIVIISESVIRKLVSDETFYRWAKSLGEYLSIGWIETARLSTILSFLITVVAVTFLLVLFGEVAPKIYANLNNVKHARMMASPLTLLSKLFFPINQVLVKSTGRIEESVYRKRLQSSNNTDKRELDKAIELTVTEEQDREEVDILKGIIKFGDVTAKQIMKSRVDVIGLEISDDYPSVIKTIMDSGFSRLPVYEEDFDNVKGILYVKDLLGLTNEAKDYDWSKLIRESVLYVPESKKIDDLLKEFQLKRTHMAIVVDEYGGSSGIVTLEDIMEEVVGDIRDEFDSEEEVDYVKIDDKNFIFEGKTLLNDVVRIAGLDDDCFESSRGHADTLAGLILEIEGRIPKRDKEIIFHDMRLRIMAVNKRRIERVKITL